MQSIYPPFAIFCDDGVHIINSLDYLGHYIEPDDVEGRRDILLFDSHAQRLSLRVNIETQKNIFGLIKTKIRYVSAYLNDEPWPTNENLIRDQLLEYIKSHGMNIKIDANLSTKDLLIEVLRYSP